MTANRSYHGDTGSEVADDLLPPHSTEAEQQVLGAIFFSKNAIVDVVDILSPDDFYRGPHARIYTACLDLFKRGEPIDLVYVTEWLNDKGILEAAGGRPYVMDLCLSVTTAEAIRWHANIVKQHSIRRKLQNYAREVIAIAQTDQDTSTISFAQSELLKIATELDNKQERKPRELAQEAYESLKHRIENPNELVGISTGLPTLDGFLGGLQPSKLIILGARPSMGKSGLALNLAVNVALVQKVPVLFYSLEMGPKEMMERALIGIAESPGRVDLLHNASRLVTDNLIIIDTPNLTTAKLRASIIKNKLRMGGPGLVVIDYLQLMKASGNTRVEEISAITRELKLLALEFNIPIMALSQLSRKVEERQDKRPMNSDLRDSGTIEQDADQVLFIYRDDYYNPDSDKRGLAEIIVSKNRGGRTGSFELLFRANIVKFMEKVSANVF